MKSLSAREWSREVVDQLKDTLRQAEVEPGIPFQSYISDLCWLRFLILYSELEEPTIRLLYHRYLQMKQQAKAIQDKLPQIAEFVMLYGNLKFDSISAMIEKEIHALAPDYVDFGKIVRKNYRVNLWRVIAKAYSKIREREILVIFGVKNIEELTHEGFQVAKEGDFCVLKLPEVIEDPVEQSEVQMRILQQVIASIESNKA